MRAGLGAGMGGGRYGAIPDTVFATIFLVRGRAPVMMNKLQWTATGKQPDPWDERPCDVANCAHWAGGQIERYLNWQVVNLKVSADALHDAPILYIAGSEAMTFDPADTDKLRDFVHGGGMILGNADCGSRLFTKSFTDLAAKLFPKYEFRDLPPTHPIYTNEQFRSSKWSTHSRVLGLSNGVRELMILIPDADLSRVWQVRAEKTRQDTYQLGQDIFLYSIDKENLLDRGETYVVKARESVKTTHEIKVARLIAGDNPDPEPGGWAHLAAIMQNGDKAHLDVHAVKLGTGDLAKYKIAHWTGTTKVQLKDEQRKELKTFVDNGGTLIVDSAGGSTAFADSAQTELEQAFGGAAAARQLATPLPRSHAVFSDPQWKVDEIRYRSFAKPLIGKLSEPRLCGIQTEAGRIGVFYSREDLSAGLVGEQVDGVLGYDPDVAAQLMRSMILYADNAAK
jgi:hypothetical protein